MRSYQLFILALFTVSSSGVYGLVSHPYSLEKLWTEASIVIKARVKMSSVLREGQRNFTRYQLDTSEIYQVKGQYSRLQIQTAEINAHLPGGEKDGLSQVVLGVPRMEKSKEYILFLRCPSIDRCVPLGYGQGVWAFDEETKGWRALDHTLVPTSLTLAQLVESKPLSGSQPHSPQVEARP